MKLISSAFDDGSTIPSKYGYNQENINPPLTIHEIPENTKSFVLIMDDPDAKKAVGKVWTHWIMWNILPNVTNIPENSIPENSLEGKTDFGEIGYGGPAPPDREHTYYFKLYALKTMLNNPRGSSKKDIEDSMHGHVLDMTELRGKFSPQ